MEDRSAYLKIVQQDVIHDAVRVQPLATGTSLRRNLKNISPQQQVSPELKKSIQRLVIKEKVSVMAQELDGVKMDGSYGSIAVLAQAKSFVDKVKAHNAEVEAKQNGGHHLTPGTAIISEPGGYYFILFFWVLLFLLFLLFYPKKMGLLFLFCLDFGFLLLFLLFQYYYLLLFFCMLLFLLFLLFTIIYYYFIR